VIKSTSFEVLFYLLFKFYYYYFRAVEQAERETAVAYATADNHSGVIHLFHTGCIRRKNTLVWYKHTAVSKRYAKLSAVGMPCQCQVYAVVAVGVYKFRSVTQQQFKCVVVFCQL